MESYTVVAFLFVIMFGNGMALKCRNCVSSKSFNDCELMGEIAECNATIVNANHELLYNDNPTLQQGNGTEFKCYRFEGARLFPNNTDTGLRGYARGCTFLNTTFCNGWVSTVNVTSCSTCTTDNCDQNPPVIPQTTTVAPQTSTVTPPSSTVSRPSSTVSPQTSTPSNQVTTSTEKPNGAGIVTISSITTIGCLSILFALEARGTISF